jgi:hypothetical protein
MVLMMYWNEESENQRKVRREEKLRAKKLGFQEAVITPEPESSSSGEGVEQLKVIISQQDKKLDLLSEALIKQQELLKEILNHKPQEVVREIVRVEMLSTPKEVEPETPRPKFRRLEDVDVAVIDTSGIEAVGQAGEVIVGQDISSQVEKLKQLRRKK